MVIYGKFTDTSNIYIQLILYLAIQEVSDSMLLIINEKSYYTFYLYCLYVLELKHSDLATHINCLVLFCS